MPRNDGSMVQGISQKNASASTRKWTNSGTQPYKYNNCAFEDAQKDTSVFAGFPNCKEHSKEDAAESRDVLEDSREDDIYLNIMCNLGDINNSLSRHRRSLLKEECRFLKNCKDEIIDDEDGIDMEWGRLAEIERMLREELEKIHLEFHFVSSESEGGSNVTVSREIRSQGFGHYARCSVLDDLNADFDGAVKEAPGADNNSLAFSKAKATANSQGTTPAAKNSRPAKSKSYNGLSRNANVNSRTINKSFDNASMEFLRVAFLATRFRDGWSRAPEHLAFADIHKFRVLTASEL